MAEESDTVTFEEAREEYTKEREEEGEEPYVTFEVPMDGDVDLEERVENLETVIRSTPGRLSDRPEEADVSQVTDSIRTDIDNITQGFSMVDINNLLEQQDVSVSIPDLADSLATAESQLDYLQNIAQSNMSILQMLTTLSQTQVDMLEAIFSLETSMSEFSRITVSGSNQIDEADVPQPVVPNTDDTGVVTRTLFMKAAEDNTSPIAIGDDEVDPVNGWVLHENEHLILDMDLSQNDILWMASEDSGQLIELLGVV